jgi:hypothetical protein
VVFTGIGILLQVGMFLDQSRRFSNPDIPQAIKDVRADQDTLIDLFGRMESFFMRLEKYIHFRPTAAMTDVIVKIMVEVISVLGIVTKEIRQGTTSTAFLVDITPKVDLRTEKYLKKLAGRKDVEDAFLRLEKLAPEEALMAAAETMAVTRDIDDTVKDVDKRLGSVDERVIQGGLFFLHWPPNPSSAFDLLGVKETGVAIQQVFNQVNNLNRESSPKLITADSEASNSLTGTELRKDLRKWIAPPDPSVNFNTASDAHHEGTAAWCTKGNTVVTWKESGSLLWIHGKRTYPIQFTLCASLFTDNI